MYLIRRLKTEKTNLEKEINKLNENVHCMEQSICRKDTLIENLTQSLAAQKGKKEMALRFYNWKANHLDKSREVRVFLILTLLHIERPSSSFILWKSTTVYQLLQ